LSSSDRKVLRYLLLHIPRWTHVNVEVLDHIGVAIPEIFIFQGAHHGLLANGPLYAMTLLLLGRMGEAAIPHGPLRLRLQVVLSKRVLRLILIVASS
jgi:hypothetical protein